MIPDIVYSIASDRAEIGLRLHMLEGGCRMVLKIAIFGLRTDYRIE